MIDCFDGTVISWSIGRRPDAELVNTMLDAAIETVHGSNDRPEWSSFARFPTRETPAFTFTPHEAAP